MHLVLSAACMAPLYKRACPTLASPCSLQRPVCAAPTPHSIPLTTSLPHTPFKPSLPAATSMASGYHVDWSQKEAATQWTSSCACCTSWCANRAISTPWAAQQQLWRKWQLMTWAMMIVVVRVMMRVVDFCDG